MDKWGKTLRLAFLLVITTTAIGTLLRFVRLDEQWIWVLFSALGVSGVANYRMRRDSNKRE